MTTARHVAPSSRRGPSARFLLVVLGMTGWMILLAIGAQLAAADARNVGFDLALILEAGRDVAAGRSPYEATMVAGEAPKAPSLFYSYPPPVAQLASAVAGLPLLAGMAILASAALTGFAIVVDQLRAALAPTVSRSLAALAVVALAPYCLPLFVGLLFGNLDVLFPAAYGLIVLAAILAPRFRVAGAVGLVSAVLTKLHPASLGVWFVVRGLRQRRHHEPAGAMRLVVVAIALGAGVIAASVVVGGVQPWLDYLAVVRSGTSSDVVDARNAGPAAQAALLLGFEGGIARVLQLPITLAALAVTTWAAWTRSDPLEGIAWAAAASLATLPVTWYHYPVAILPVAAAALLRALDRPDARAPVVLLLGGALGVVTIAVAVLPLVWVSLGLVILAVRRSAARAPDASSASAAAA